MDGLTRIFCDLRMFLFLLLLKTIKLKNVSRIRNVFSHEKHFLKRSLMDGLTRMKYVLKRHREPDIQFIYLSGESSHASPYYNFGFIDPDIFGRFLS